MKCPNCGAENDSRAVRCSSCGSELQNTEQLAAGMSAVTTGGIVLGKKAREARIREIVDPSAVISVRAYNGVICAVLLWGLLINYLLCWKVGSYTNLFPNMSPVAFLVGYAVLALVGILMTVRAQSPVVSFIGYNLVVIPFGVSIATIVEAYGGIGSGVVALAFLYTLLIAVAMLATAVVFPALFDRIGGALGAVLAGLVLCEVLLMIFRVRQEVSCWIAAGLFSFYLGYDIHRSQQYPKTVKNAVSSALDIYLDLANLFIRLLEILSKKDD